MKSKVEVSHFDPIYDVVWINSKTGQECASVASDGRLLFWDCRKLDEFVDECVLNNGGSKGDEKTLGGCCLEWMQEAGASKFLVGTEHGITLGCNRKPKKACDISNYYGAETKGGIGKHFGPVYSCKRNYSHVKWFLTAGDWCAKFWVEDLKGPILKTPYCPAFISAAAWSPTRCGVFFLCRHDGVMDTWDYFYRMNEVSLSQKISDVALTSVNIQPNGQFMVSEMLKAQSQWCN
jgi:dynein intermediate chain 2